MQIRKDDDGDQVRAAAAAGGVAVSAARMWCESRLTVVIHQLQKPGATL